MKIIIIKITYIFRIILGLIITIATIYTYSKNILNFTVDIPLKLLGYTIGLVLLTFWGTYLISSGWFQLKNKILNKKILISGIIMNIIVTLILFSTLYKEGNIDNIILYGIIFFILIFIQDFYRIMKIKKLRTTKAHMQ